jgi:hypothetical protein
MVYYRAAPVAATVSVEFSNTASNQRKRASTGRCLPAPTRLFVKRYEEETNLRAHSAGRAPALPRAGPRQAQIQHSGGGGLTTHRSPGSAVGLVTFAETVELKRRLRHQHHRHTLPWPCNSY